MGKNASVVVHGTYRGVSCIAFRCRKGVVYPEQITNKVDEETIYEMDGRWCVIQDNGVVRFPYENEYFIDFIPSDYMYYPIGVLDE